MNLLSRLRTLQARPGYAGLLPLLLVLLSGLSGLVPFRLLSDIQFLFIGLFVYAAIALFGTAWGLAAALAGSAAALGNLGHPFSILLCLAEVATVSWAVRRKGYSLTLSVLGFWLVPGQLTVRLAFRFALDQPGVTADLVVFKAALTSLGCAAAASILIPYVHHYLLRFPRLYPDRGERAAPMAKLSLHQLFSNLIVALLITGMLAQLTYTTNRQVRDLERNLHTRIGDAWNQFQDSVSLSNGIPYWDYLGALSDRYPDYRFLVRDGETPDKVYSAFGKQEALPYYLTEKTSNGHVDRESGDGLSQWIPNGPYRSGLELHTQSVLFQTGAWQTDSRYTLIVSYQPSGEWNAAYRDLAYGMALIFDMTGLAILIVFPVCRRLTRKLVLLSEQSARFTSHMGAGYKPEWSDSRFRELHTLSESLRVMAGHLNRQFDEMENRQLQLARHAADATVELDLERKRLDGLLTNIHDVVWSLDARTNGLLYISPACRELFGYPEDYFMNGIDWIFELLHEEDLPAFLTYYQDPARSDKGYATLRFRIHHADGTLRWIQDRSWRVLDRNGDILKIDGIASDITEAVNAQNTLLHLSFELSKEKEQIEIQRNITQSILEATREGMLLCGQQGEILFTNSRLQNFFGVQLLEAATIDELFNGLPGMDPEPSRLLLEDLHSFLKKGSGELSFRRSFPYTIGSQVYYYSVYAEPVPNRLGLEGGRLLVFRDRTEEELQEVMKEDLANQISHELRTPLTSILGFTEILNNRELAPERRRTYISTIHKEAIRLSRLVDDFLDLQRMEAGHQRYFYAPMDLRDLAAEAAENWGLEDMMRLRLELPDHPVRLLADADRIKQVLHNLISNAFKYSPDHTPVTVTVRQDNDLVYVDVKDEGLGIPEGDKENIFRKFYRVDHADRRKIPGSGLGLTIVKEIVEAHHGEITFRSEHGAGSVFSIWMPAYQVPETKGKIILVLRNEEYARELSGLLEEQQLPVLVLRSFEEALLALNTGPGLPLCMAADLVGAGLMNGLEFASRIRTSPAGSRPLLFLEALDRANPGANRDGVRFKNRSFSAEEFLRLVAAGSAMETADFRCCFPLQDPVQLLAQLSKFGLHPHELQEDGSGLWADFKREG